MATKYYLHAVLGDQTARDYLTGLTGRKEEVEEVNGVKMRLFFCPNGFGDVDVALQEQKRNDLLRIEAYERNTVADTEWIELYDPQKKGVRRKMPRVPHIVRQNFRTR